MALNSSFAGTWAYCSGTSRVSAVRYGHRSSGTRRGCVASAIVAYNARSVAVARLSECSDSVPCHRFDPHSGLVLSPWHPAHALGCLSAGTSPEKSIMPATQRPSSGFASRNSSPSRNGCSSSLVVQVMTNCASAPHDTMRGWLVEMNSATGL